MGKSMTGFGKGRFSDGKRSITAEIKAVNHRYCDVYVKMSRRYSFAEEKIKAVVKDRLQRGKIEVSIYVDDFGDSESDVRVNTDAAGKYYKAFKTLKDNFVLDGDDGISLGMLSAMPDVITTAPAKDDEEETLRMLLSAVDKALDGMCEMRAAEGVKMADDILMRADLIENMKNEIEKRAPEVGREYAVKLKARIEELLGGSIEVPEDRIMLEAAMFADKANITEELVRLGSHISQLRDFMNTDGEAVGKKIDFLVQEMNREANTIGSKANDTEITSIMLDIKAEIEKIREQVQNIA